MNRKIKVLMIADCPRDLGNVKGGLEAATVNLIRGIPDSEAELHVVTIRKDIQKKETVQALNHTLYYEPYTVKRSKLLEFLLFGNRKIKNLYRLIQPDIVHMQGTGPIMLMLRGIDKRKVVITQHGIMSEELKYKISVPKKLKFFIKAAYEKLLIPRFNNYISISDYNHRILSHLQRKNPLFNTSIIYNAVNDDFFVAEPVQNQTGIVFTGLVNKLKGVHLLLEAVSNLKKQGIDYQVDIAGGTKEPEYMRLIEETIIKQGLESQVTMHGWISQRKVKELLTQNALFVLPSLQECLPISIAEAMAAGRVVIATRTGGIPEMFTDKESGFLFEKNNVQELTRILADLSQQHDKMRQMATAAKHEAMEKFHPSRVAGQTLQFYRSLTKTS